MVSHGICRSICKCARVSCVDTVSILSISSDRQRVSSYLVGSRRESAKRNNPGGFSMISSHLVVNMIYDVGVGVTSGVTDGVGVLDGVGVGVGFTYPGIFTLKLKTRSGSLLPDRSRA